MNYFPGKGFPQDPGEEAPPLPPEYLVQRPRRLRAHPALRRLVREGARGLDPDDAERVGEEREPQPEALRRRERGENAERRVAHEPVLVHERALERRQRRGAELAGEEIERGGPHDRQGTRQGSR